MNLKKLEIEIDEYRSLKKQEQVLSCSQKLLHEALIQNNKYYQIVASYHIANSYYLQGDFSKALKIALNTLQLCSVIEIPFYEMVLNNLAGILYGSLGDEITSIEYVLKAYYIALEHPDLNFIYIIENNLGVLFFNLEMNEIAYSYFCKSLERREIDNFDKITERDGFNIINIIGCCIKMKLKNDYEKWQPYLNYYMEHFKNTTVEDDYLLYKIYQDYYIKDIKKMDEHIYMLINQSKSNTDCLHTLKNMMQIFKLSLNIRNKNTCENIFEYMEDIIKKYPDYQYISKLIDFKIQMNLAFYSKEGLLDVLYQFYIDKKKEDKQWKANLKKSLMTKVELEETLHKQKEILKQNDKLMKNSEIEDFTKVLNKTAFKKYVEESLKHFKDDQYMAMFVIDIDKFKSINDHYGHLSGDKLLLDVVDILKSDIRETDFIGRIGGDEFCVFMRNILSLEYIKEKAVLLLNDIKTIKVNSLSCNMTISAGIEIIAKPCSYEELFECADQLMYKAKAEGGNRYYIKLHEERQ